MKVRYLLLHAYGMGGTIRTVINQANELVARGHDVELVSVVRRREHVLFRLDPRVRLSTLVDERQGRIAVTFGGRVMRRLRGKVVPYGEYAAGFFTPAVEAAMVEYVSGLRDGVLVTTRPALNLAAARYAHPDVVTVGQEHLNLASHRDPVRAAIARHYPKLRALAVLTPTDRQDYQRLIPGLPIVQIPNAVSGSRRRRSRLTNKTVLAAGRLHTQKGFDLLISAFAQVAKEHPDWTLKIFGAGPKKHELRLQIDELNMGGHIKLMGRAPTLEDELAEASIYALSSRFEGLPMVMLEAMTHGLAIAAFDCPTGPGDVLTHEIDGLLVPPENTAELSAAINRLIEDPGLRTRLGEAAYATAAAYTPEAVTPRWERLFTELSPPD